MFGLYYIIYEYIDPLCDNNLLLALLILLHKYFCSSAIACLTTTGLWAFFQLSLLFSGTVSSSIVPI